MRPPCVDEGGPLMSLLSGLSLMSLEEPVSVSAASLEGRAPFTALSMDDSLFRQTGYNVPYGGLAAPSLSGGGGSAQLGGSPQLGGSTQLGGSAQLEGSAQLGGSAQFGSTLLGCSAQLGGSAQLGRSAEFGRSAELGGTAQLVGAVSGEAQEQRHQQNSQQQAQRQHASSGYRIAINDVSTLSEPGHRYLPNTGNIENPGWGNNLLGRSMIRTDDIPKNAAPRQNSPSPLWDSSPQPTSVANVPTTSKNLLPAPQIDLYPSTSVTPSFQRGARLYADTQSLLTLPADTSAEVPTTPINFLTMQGPLRNSRPIFQYPLNLADPTRFRPLQEVQRSFLKSPLSNPQLISQSILADSCLQSSLATNTNRNITHTNQELDRLQPAAESSGKNATTSKPFVSTFASPSLLQLLPPLSNEALAPLHLVFPIILPASRIFIAKDSSLTSPTRSSRFNNHGLNCNDYPSHHYHFSVPPGIDNRESLSRSHSIWSANRLFSRLHGFCNQSPSWLALDLGYIGCREHQVNLVTERFITFFTANLSQLAAAFSDRNAIPLNYEAMASATAPIASNNARGNRNNALSAQVSEPEKLLMCDAQTGEVLSLPPVSLQARGIRMRADHGNGWVLYETPVIPQTERDKALLDAIVALIERFNKELREARLCQNAAMKPFRNMEFAIVVLKQVGTSIRDEELIKLQECVVNNIALTEVRLIRHKLTDKYGNALFDKDPRFGGVEIYGRPMAQTRQGRQARVVFAETNMPPVYTCPSSIMQQRMQAFDR